MFNLYFSLIILNASKFTFSYLILFRNVGGDGISSLSPYVEVSSFGSCILSYPHISISIGDVSHRSFCRNIPANCPTGFHPGKKISQRGSPGKNNLPAGIPGQKFSIPGHFQTSAKISFALYPGERKPIPVKIFRYTSPVKIFKSTGALGRDVLTSIFTLLSASH